MLVVNNLKGFSAAFLEQMNKPQAAHLSGEVPKKFERLSAVFFRLIHRYSSNYLGSLDFMPLEPGLLT